MSGRVAAMFRHCRGNTNATIASDAFHVSPSPPARDNPILAAVSAALMNGSMVAAMNTSPPAVAIGPPGFDAIGCSHAFVPVFRSIAIRSGLSHAPVIS